MSRELLSGLIITKILSVNTIYTAEGTGNRRNLRERWAILFKFEGETVYETEQGKYVSNAQNMVVLPKGSSYTWHCVRSGFYSVIEFEAEASCSDIFSFQIRDALPYQKIFKELQRKAISGDDAFELFAKRGAYTILYGLLSERSQAYVPTAKAKIIAPALEYIAAKYYTEISNATLADLSGISEVYFRKLFTEIMGISPMKYIGKLRIEKAKEMLRVERAKISDIALSVGYSSIYHFSKIFKQYEGVSPTVYIATKGDE